MTDKVKGLMISAPRKSSGKTTFTLGLISALKGLNKTVRVFKKGPDYIDPMWHKVASGQTCYNIDPYWMDDQQCRTAFLSRTKGSDLCLVEGNHGLHDGLDLQGSNSGAALAKLLKIPVLLVVDGSGMNRGVAALVLGHQQLDPDVHIGGIVLNNVASQRQADKQRAAIEHFCGIPVVGALPRNRDVGIKERHLGLVTIHENPEVEQVIADLGALVAEHCDLDVIMEIAGEIHPDTDTGDAEPVAPTDSKLCRIGVAYDSAFCFYYPDNLEALEVAGAELVYFNTMKDQQVPDIDGLYIGGGFPESFLQELEANRPLREELKSSIQNGLPVYAECGGLMYLTRSIERHGVKKSMVGAIPADVQFQETPVGKGYSELQATDSNGWLTADSVIKGHEFHYSRLINIDPALSCGFKVVRGTGIDGKQDGILYQNVLASYTHLHAGVVKQWAGAFVNYVISKGKKKRT